MSLILVLIGWVTITSSGCNGVPLVVAPWPFREHHKVDHRMNQRLHPASISPMGIVFSFWVHRSLIWKLTQREVMGRYRGSILGISWSLFYPLLMLGVYTFVFGAIFRTRWPSSSSDSMLEFAVILFTGLIVYGIFAESVNRAPGLIVSQPNFVKKVVFPLEVMAWVNLGSALFHGFVSFLVLLAFLVFSPISLHWTALLLPVVLVPLTLLCLGLGWLFSSLGVFIRDIGQLVGVATTALLFLSPIFFPSSALPPKARWLVSLNPLSFPVEQAREVVIWGHLPDWEGLLLYTAISCVIAWLGFIWFQRSRSAMADVI